MTQSVVMPSYLGTLLAGNLFRRVSGSSEVQLQIPQGFVESDEEDEMYEEV